MAEDVGGFVKPAAFLDRDGVLNRDVGYLQKPACLEWMPDAKEAVTFLRGHGYRVFVVTNQSGVARGFYSEDAVSRIHSMMQQELQAAGTKIDAFVYCPHHPNALVERYRIACSCRKPAPGMILQLLRRYTTDRENSFVVGDKESDISAAAAAGLPGYLYRGGSLLGFVREILKRPGHSCST